MPSVAAIHLSSCRVCVCAVILPSRSNLALTTVAHVDLCGPLVCPDAAVPSRTPTFAGDLLAHLLAFFQGSKDLVNFSSRRHSAIPVRKIAIGSWLVLGTAVTLCYSFQVLELAQSCKVCSQYSANTLLYFQSALHAAEKMCKSPPTLGVVYAFFYHRTSE